MKQIQMKVGKYLGSIVSLLLFGSVLIERYDIFDGLIVGKYLYFNEIVCLMGVFVGLYSFFFIPKISLYIGKLEILLTFYLGYIVVHSFIFETNFEPKFFAQITLLIVCFIGKQYFGKTKNDISLKILLLFFLLFGLYEGFLGSIYIFENRHHFNPLQLKGSFHNSGIYAIYLSTHFVLSATILLQNKSQNRLDFFLKIVSIAVLILLGYVLICTQSRTAWIASFLGITYTITKYYKVSKRFKEIVKSISLKLVFLVLLIGCIWVGGKQLYQFKQHSAIGRVLVWKVSLEMVKEYPIFGRGFSRFSQTYDNYQANYFSKVREAKEIFVAGKVQYAFNDYLQIIIEYGFVGFLLFLGLVLCTFYKHENIYQGVLITCLIANFSSYPIEILPTSLNLYFVLILSSFDDKIFKIFTFNKIGVKLISLGFVFLSFLILNFNIKNDKIERDCFIAEYFFNNEQYSEAIIRYRKLYPDIQNNASALMIYAKALALNGNHQEAIGIYEKIQKTISDSFLCNNLGMSYQAIGDFKNAEIMYKKSNKMIPNLIYPRYLLANLYIQNKEFYKAKIIAREIVNFHVKIYSQASHEMQMQMKAYLEE